ncbi:hypothetical protein WJX79_006530 [Trebouxia sp. C0005]
MATHNKAVVAGGGPVGALAAIALARQGWHVQVFDKWPLPASKPSSQDTRAYLLNLSARAQRAFKLFDVDVTPLIAPHGGLLATIFYDKNGAVLRKFEVPVKDPPTSLRIFRDEISRLLIDEAQRLHPGKISFRFSTPVVAVNLEAHTVRVASDSGHNNVKEVPYDLLVGADGANSLVRSQLQATMPSGYVRRIRHQGVYTTTGVAVPADELPGHAFFEIHSFEEGAVFWNGRGDSDVRTGFFTASVVSDRIQAGDTEWLHERVKKGLPRLPARAKNAILEFMQSRPDFYPISSWTHVSQLHGPKVVLMGDAAHTMTPILGQGLNCGLEDVAIFAQTLEQHQGNVDTALPAYNTVRWPDVEALLNINELVANKDYLLNPEDQSAAHRLWVNSYCVLLKLHMATRTVLHKLGPSFFAPPLVPMLQGSVPYRQVASDMHTDGMMWAGVLALTAAGIAHLLQ